jgi:hypothetical protein
MQKAQRIYSVLLAANTDWAKSFSAEAGRILSEGLQFLPKQINLDNFYEVISYFEFYILVKNTSRYTVPEMESYLHKLVSGDLINEEFLRKISISNIRDFGSVLNFISQMPNSERLVNLFINERGEEFFNFNDLKGLEKVRQALNEVNTTLGDGLLITIGSKYINEK